MARITINGVTVDPLAKGPALAAAPPRAKDASGSDYILIQTREPLTDEQRAKLASLGVVIHEYVPDDTYLAGFKGTDLKAIRALKFVTWADVYLRDFKVPPTLRPASALAGAERSPSRKMRQVDIVLHEDANPEAVREQVAAAARVNPEDVTAGRGKVRLTVQEGALDSLADIDAVHHVEPVPERQLFNNVARGILDADVTINGTKYQGAGQVVAVADTGFDKGSRTDVHPAFTGRVKKLYALGRTSPAKSDDPHGHGTHVAGSVLGDGNSKKMGGKIQGTAPKAKLVLQSTLDSAGSLGGIPVDLHDLFAPPYTKDGARVHTNSWGATTPGLAYDASAREIDDMVWNHQDLVICFAAGNDGADSNSDGIADRSSVGSQSAAKNCITVGASESKRRFKPTYGDYWPGDFPADPLESDLQADDPDGMVAFSSRGPTKERRFKPDVVAPGTCILSTLSRKVASPSTDFGVSTDPLFFFDSGTSMATPLVAGCAAVLRETLIKNGTATPSAALIKALLIEGAVPLAGQYTPTEAGASPNNNSGWGRVDLAGSVIIPGPDPNSGCGDGKPLKQGGEDTIGIEIPERKPGGAVPAAVGVTLKVTLVWSDPPGAALQNDLDLIVRASNGAERHGNAGTTKKFDRTNNVEQVLWTNIPPGHADIVIRAHRITRFAQPYAYAWRIG
jgi:serine protease AprX